MLRNVKRYTYIFIALFILCQLSLATTATDGIRSAVAASLSPTWRLCSGAKNGFLKLTTIWPSGGYYTPPKVREEIEKLRLENYSLLSQLELLKAQVDLEKLVGHQAELLKQFAKDNDYSKRRKAEIFRLIELYMPSMMGKVIFRESSSWNSSFWINLGEKTNQALGKIIVAKNSPVVVGTSVLGIVEYVGQHRSRIRLITDSSIVASIRVVRGSDQKDNLYLAKGELQGVRDPLFRGRHPVFRGVGFNYDIEDEEGPARDLQVCLASRGDILVTTGMDGIFPAGLRVGQVSKVHPLREGSTAYELDILPFFENFDDISFVTVLPPLRDCR